jgi:hypothetical protein
VAKLSRSLTDRESFVLDLLKQHYGPWNTIGEVFLSDESEAIIFVKDAAGNSPVCVNLTVRASLYEEREFTLEEPRAEWLQIPPDA